MSKKYWIMKSEPSEYSIDDLKKDGEEFWDGIRNYQVRNMFRDEMKVGDKALFYHSSTKVVGVVGEMEVIKGAEPDQTQFDKKNKHYDSGSTKEDPRWLGVTLKFISKFNHIVTLDEIKRNNFFSDLALIKKGNRLSVMPISKKHYEELVKLGK